MANPRDVDLEIVGHDRTERATRSAGRNLDRLERKLKGVGGVASTAAKNVVSSLGSVATAVPPVAKGIGLAIAAAMAVTAAPQITMMLSGAIMTGGVLGVIGLAAYLQKDNPRLKRAVDKMKKTVGDGLKKASAPLADDFVESVRKITKSADENMPLVSRAFKAVEPAIGKLTDGIIGFVEQAAPGFVRMLEKSQPVIDAIADRLPALGAAVGKVFDAIGNSAPEATTATTDLMNAVIGTILILAKFISVMAKAYTKSRDVFLGIAGVVASAMSVAVTAVSKFVSGTLRGLAWIADATGQDRMAAKLRSAADSVDQTADRIQGDLRRIQSTINSLRGKTVTVNVAVNKQQLAGVPGYTKQPGTAFATTTWAPTFAAAPGAGSIRVDAPNVTVDSRVFLDGQVIAAQTRSIVNDSASRQAWRARVGRR